MNTVRTRLFPILALAALLFGACTLPRAEPTPTVSPADRIETASALTLEAQQTQDALSGPTTAAPTTTQPGDLTQTATSTLISTQSATPDEDACDVVRFVDDVTVPDGTEFEPGESFTKVWRLRNDGTCTWDSDYDLVFFSGDAMSGPASQQLTTGTVAPGQEIDVEVDLTAPTDPDTYRGNYKLRNGDGVIFGLSNGGPFWVEIEVVAAATATPATVYSLYNNAPSAVWITNAGTISFGGPDTDTDGFAMYKNGELLEDGSTPARVLETHPAWQENGVITGRFPDYTVQAGDRFVARIGFLAKNDGSCGVGDVQFQFNYRIGTNPVTPIDSWYKSCNGSLIEIDIDLSDLVGTTVRFILGALANGPSSQDWAVWVNPRIVR